MQHQIYFCNIQMKYMQHISETHETYGCNMCSSTCCGAGTGEANHWDTSFVGEGNCVAGCP